jgi:hypothetical protein
MKWQHHHATVESADVSASCVMFRTAAAKGVVQCNASYSSNTLPNYMVLVCLYSVIECYRVLYEVDTFGFASPFTVSAPNSSRGSTLSQLL